MVRLAEVECSGNQKKKRLKTRAATDSLAPSPAPPQRGHPGEGEIQGGGGPRFPRATSYVKTTEIYAERDLELVRKIAREIG